MSQDLATTMPVHRAIVLTLQQLGVETIFGVMGDANMQYMAGWSEAGGRAIPSVLEGGAVGMADGYARSSGRLGVVTVTHGPGVTNALTSLTEAVRAGSPVLMLTGDTSATKRYERQNIDLQAAANLSGAEYRRVLAPSHIVDDLVMAARRVMVNRVPVILDIPYDLLQAEIAYAASVFHDPASFARRPAMLPDPESMDQALGIIASARRPIILAGRGCAELDCKEALIELAELIGAPVSTTLLGRGLFHDQDFNLDVFGTISHPVTAETIADADCVIAFGASLNAFTTVRNAYLEGKRVVQCDVEPRHLGRFARVDAQILGDATSVAKEMIVALRTDGTKPGGFRSEQLRDALATRVPADDFVDESKPGTLDVRTVCIALDSLLPADRLVVTDGGRFRSGVWPYLHVTHPTRFTHSVNFGSIGLATAVGIGEAVAHPRQVTVSAVGDGGGAMGLAEFTVAVRESLPFVLLMFNDGAYGAEYLKLPEFGIDPRSSLLAWPEFADVARALGGHGITARSMDDVHAAAAMIDEGRLPLLIDVKCDPAMAMEITS